MLSGVIWGIELCKVYDTGTYGRDALGFNLSFGTAKYLDNFVISVLMRIVPW